MPGKHGLGALECSERLVISVEDPQGIRQRQPCARLEQRIGPEVDHFAQRCDRVVRMAGARLQFTEQATREAEVERLARKLAGALRELDGAVEPQ